MIVITGPGRGGTSLIASLYRELGFDQGGEWFDDTNAGSNILPSSSLTTIRICGPRR